MNPPSEAETHKQSHSRELHAHEAKRQVPLETIACHIHRKLIRTKSTGKTPTSTFFQTTIPQTTLISAHRQRTRVSKQTISNRLPKLQSNNRDGHTQPNPNNIRIEKNSLHNMSQSQSTLNSVTLRVPHSLFRDSKHSHLNFP